MFTMDASPDSSSLLFQREWREPFALTAREKLIFRSYKSNYVQCTLCVVFEKDVPSKTDGIEGERRRLVISFSDLHDFLM